VKKPGKIKMMTEESIADRLDELRAERVGLEAGLESQYIQLNAGNIHISNEIYQTEQRIETLKFAALELEKILRG
jgi:hypothetical protein